ncbi:hypothetical protein BJ742DRAFT_887040 [Cladochytrium replicatum]|nr:hypothetical protein BJ742DRAFT_887040 [Cladochytrium replicatum]
MLPKITSKSLGSLSSDDDESESDDGASVDNESTDSSADDDDEILNKPTTRTRSPPKPSYSGSTFQTPSSNQSSSRDNPALPKSYDPQQDGLIQPIRSTNILSRSPSARPSSGSSPLHPRRQSIPLRPVPIPNSRKPSVQIPHLRRKSKVPPADPPIPGTTEGTKLALSELEKERPVLRVLNKVDPRLRGAAKKVFGEFTPPPEEHVHQRKLGYFVDILGGRRLSRAVVAGQEKNQGINATPAIMITESIADEQTKEDAALRQGVQDALALLPQKATTGSASNSRRGSVSSRRPSQPLPWSRRSSFSRQGSNFSISSDEDSGGPRLSRGRYGAPNRGRNRKASASRIRLSQSEMDLLVESTGQFKGHHADAYSRFLTGANCIRLNMPGIGEITWYTGRGKSMVASLNAEVIHLLGGANAAPTPGYGETKKRIEIPKPSIDLETSRPKPQEARVESARGTRERSPKRRGLAQRSGSGKKPKSRVSLANKAPGEPHLIVGPPTDGIRPASSKKRPGSGSEAARIVVTGGTGAGTSRRHGFTLSYLRVVNPSKYKRALRLEAMRKETIHKVENLEELRIQKDELVFLKEEHSNVARSMHELISRMLLQNEERDQTVLSLLHKANEQKSLFRTQIAQFFRAHKRQVAGNHDLQKKATERRRELKSVSNELEELIEFKEMLDADPSILTRWMNEAIEGKANRKLEQEAQLRIMEEKFELEKIETEQATIEKLKDILIEAKSAISAGDIDEATTASFKKYNRLRREIALHQEHHRNLQQDIEDLEEVKESLNQEVRSTVDTRRRVFQLQKCMDCSPDMEFLVANPREQKRRMKESAPLTYGLREQTPVLRSAGIRQVRKDSVASTRQTESVALKEVLKESVHTTRPTESVVLKEVLADYGQRNHRKKQSMSIHAL